MRHTTRISFYHIIATVNRTLFLEEFAQTCSNLFTG